MAATTPRHVVHLPHRQLSAIAGLFWFLVTAGLAMTAALLVLGGPAILESAAVQTALIVGVVLFALHAWTQYRHRAEILRDERLRRARERRGF